MKRVVAAIGLTVVLFVRLTVCQGGATEATPGNHIHVVTLICEDWDSKDKSGKKKQVQLGFKYIEWDDKGKTEKISGLEPFLETSLNEKFKILSDLNDVPLKDGTFIVKIENGAEIPCTIRFDNTLMIPNEQQKKLFGLLSGWNLKSESIDISALILEGKGPVMPQRVWIKQDADYAYLLVKAKGTKEYVSQAKEPIIFLNLYFDSDGDPKTGCLGKKIAGQELSGFDISAALSFAQVRNKDGKVSSVLNCQVQKWDGKQFAGKLIWGTQWNMKMSASYEGDYASFATPRSILEVTKKGTPARIALEVPDVKYVEGKKTEATLNIKDK